jgi:hypothetical protein
LVKKYYDNKAILFLFPRIVPSQNKSMRNRQVSIFVGMLAIWMVSCDRPDCNNDNPIFEIYQPDSKEYKTELAEVLNTVDQSKLKYWLQKYDEQSGIETLYFYVQGDGLCAVLHLTVSDWNKLEKVRERKGVGRRGAEFTNLKFNIVQDSTHTQFVYHTFDRIID